MKHSCCQCVIAIIYYIYDIFNIALYNDMKLISICLIWALLVIGIDVIFVFSNINNENSFTYCVWVAYNN